jgi:hypothetical protein
VAGNWSFPLGHYSIEHHSGKNEQVSNSLAMLAKKIKIVVVKGSLNLIILGISYNYCGVPEVSFKSLGMD